MVAPRRSGVYYARAQTDGAPDLFATNADPIMKAATWAAYQTFNAMRRLPESRRGAELRAQLAAEGEGAVTRVTQLAHKFRAKGAMADEALYDALRVVYADMGVDRVTELARGRSLGGLGGGDVSQIMGGMVRGIACSPNAQQLIAEGVNQRATADAKGTTPRQDATNLGFEVLQNTAACRGMQLPDAPLTPPPAEVVRRPPSTVVPVVVVGAVVLVAGVFMVQRGRKAQ